MYKNEPQFLLVLMQQGSKGHHQELSKLCWQFADLKGFFHLETLVLPSFAELSESNSNNDSNVESIFIIICFQICLVGSALSLTVKEINPSLWRKQTDSPFPFAYRFARPFLNDMAKRIEK